MSVTFNFNLGLYFKVLQNILVSKYLILDSLTLTKGASHFTFLRLRAYAFLANYIMTAGKIHWLAILIIETLGAVVTDVHVIILFVLK